MEIIHFWRTKAGNEVDFVLEQNNLIPVEVKYKPFPKPALPPGIRSFIQQYATPKNYVLTMDYYGPMDFDDHEIFYLPVWLA